MGEGGFKFIVFGVDIPDLIERWYGDGCSPWIWPATTLGLCWAFLLIVSFIP